MSEMLNNFLASYASVWGISIKEARAKEEEVLKVGKEAPEVVSMYQGPIVPEESDAQQTARLKCKDARQGNYDKLATILRKTLNVDSNATSMEVVFTAYKLITEGGDIQPTTKSTEEEKGDNTMNDLNSLKEELAGNNGAAPATTGGNTPATPQNTEPSYRELSKTEAKAINEKFEKEQKARGEFSKASKVNTVILSKQNNKDLVAPTAKKTADDKVLGTIYNPEKYLEKFKEVFGVVTDPATGEPTFTSAAGASQIDNAREIYNLLTKAVGGATVELPVHTTDSIGNVIGFEVTPAGESGTQVLKQEQLLELILDKAVGFIPFDNGQQVLIKTINPTDKKDKTKQNKSVDKANSLKGLVSLRISDKKTTVEQFHKFLKVRTEEVKDLPGLKSAISAKYVKGSAEDGTLKTLTFRIPLMVPMYVCEVKDESLKVLQSEAGGKGQVAISETAGIEALKSLFGLAAQTGRATTDIFKDFNATIAEMEEKEATKEEAALNSDKIQL